MRLPGHHWNAFFKKAAVKPDHVGSQISGEGTNILCRTVTPSPMGRSQGAIYSTPCPISLQKRVDRQQMWDTFGPEINRDWL